jgi:DNA integrity scanning protein DisA with diadenylate cyclase activity
MAVLFALSQRLIQKNDVILYLSGDPGHRSLDTLMTIKAGLEHRLFISGKEYNFDQVLKHEVLERMISLACEIAAEGREGKPVGALFVLGDADRVMKYTKPLVINPFRGYTDAERNIMDPSLEETIKELSSLDGAFVVNRDGVILACGVYIRPKKSGAPLPSGLGARHQTAAAITACTNSLAVAISESTGVVSLFRKGEMFMKIEKIRSKA